MELPRTEVANLQSTAEPALQICFVFPIQWFLLFNFELIANNLKCEDFPWKSRFGVFLKKNWRCSATELAFQCGNNWLELSHNWSQLLSSSPKNPPLPKIDAWATLLIYFSDPFGVECVIPALGGEYRTLTLILAAHWKYWMIKKYWCRGPSQKFCVCLLGLNCNLGLFFRAPQVIPLSSGRLRTIDRDSEGKKAQAQSTLGTGGKPQGKGREVAREVQWNGILLAVKVQT